MTNRLWGSNWLEIVAYALSALMIFIPMYLLHTYRLAFIAPIFFCLYMLMMFFLHKMFKNDFFSRSHLLTHIFMESLFGMIMVVTSLTYLTDSEASWFWLLAIPLVASFGYIYFLFEKKIFNSNTK
jgi:hypothetical protein